MIAKLWSQYQQNIQDVKALKTKNEILKAQIESEVVKVCHVNNALMTRLSNYPESPTGFCFTNPDSENPWICLYCEIDLSKPR